MNIYIVVWSKILNLVHQIGRKKKYYVLFQPQIFIMAATCIIENILRYFTHFSSETKKSVHCIHLRESPFHLKLRFSSFSIYTRNFCCTFNVTIFSFPIKKTSVDLFIKI